MSTGAAHVSTPLPFKQPKPYIRPKIMTIAASFICKDGYVLCADRLMSHGTAGEMGSFASYEQKVFFTGYEDDSQTAAILCGSGMDGTLLHPISETLFRNLGQYDEEKVPATLERTLNDYTERLGRRPELQLLLFESTHGGLIKSDGLIVSAARSVEILGIGETSLVRFFTDMFPPSEMHIKEAVVLAALVVWAAKEYCPQYCGGQTDIVTFSIFDTWPEQVDAKKIAAMEMAFKSGIKTDLGAGLHKLAKIL